MSRYSPGMKATPGWYPTRDGQLRYWDGAAWTEHYADAPEPEPEPFARSNPQWVWWLIVLLVIVPALLWSASLL